MRGRTQRGRERTTRGLSQIPTGRPLIRLKDHGPGEPLDTKKLGFVGDRWIEPFRHLVVRMQMPLNRP